jgi:hypothetical protein
MYTQSGFCSSGYTFHLRRIGKMAEKSCGHLGAAGVVDAREDYLLHSVPFDSSL